MLQPKVLTAATFPFVCATLLAWRRVVRSPREIPFESHTLDFGSRESAAIADINSDGKIDIGSGENWYGAPHWTGTQKVSL
jgi:hypothetical protein